MILFTNKYFLLILLFSEIFLIFYFLYDFNYKYSVKNWILLIFFINNIFYLSEIIYSFFFFFIIIIFLMLFLVLMGCLILVFDQKSDKFIFQDIFEQVNKPSDKILFFKI